MRPSRGAWLLPVSGPGPSSHADTSCRCYNYRRAPARRAFLTPGGPQRPRVGRGRRDGGRCSLVVLRHIIRGGPCPTRQTLGPHGAKPRRAIGRRWGGGCMNRAAHLLVFPPGHRPRMCLRRRLIGGRPPRPWWLLPLMGRPGRPDWPETLPRSRPIPPKLGPLSAGLATCASPPPLGQVTPFRRRANGGGRCFVSFVLLFFRFPILLWGQLDARSSYAQAGCLFGSSCADMDPGRR